MSSDLSKRFSRMLSRSKGSRSSRRSPDSRSRELSNAPPDSPEAVVARTIDVFCNPENRSSSTDDEVLHLPVIVEAAESSTTAASAAAMTIRKYLTKEWSPNPYVQYHAIMLMRILTDNPGASFTQNFDKEFVETVKNLLKGCKDRNTQQFMRETLDTLEATKQALPGVSNLVQMWRKEKGVGATLNTSSRGNRQNGGNQQHLAIPGVSSFDYGTTNGGSGGRSARSPARGRLPPPVELAGRLAEANNTARILLQLIQSTPSHEILGNELIQEFRQRCQAAQRSIEEYINCDNPAPDDDTMLSLIETNEQLSLATTRYQRCVLAARRAAGATPSPNPESQAEVSTTRDSAPTHHSAFAPPPSAQPEPEHTNGEHPSDTSISAFGGAEIREQPPPVPLPRTQVPVPANPFADPVTNSTESSQGFNIDQRYNGSGYQHVKTFSIDSEPSYPQNHVSAAAGAGDYTSNANTTYTSHSTPPTSVASPVNYNVSPPQAWRNGGVTASYVGRQNSAVNHTTMHGAVLPAEIDGNSEVGRTDGHNNFGDEDDQYSVSPVSTRIAQR